MKKNIISLVLLIVVLVVTNLLMHSNDPLTLGNRVIVENAENPKDENWEYVKDKLFDGKTPEVYKIKGPILLRLTNATKEDSLLVEESMQEIREILPNKKIDFYENFARKTKYQIRAMNLKPTDSLMGYKYTELLQQSIDLSFHSSEDYSSFSNSSYFPLSVGSSILRKHGIGKGNFGPAIVMFRLKKGVFSKGYKKELIRYQIMLSLCVIHETKNVSSEIEYGSTWRSKDKIMNMDKFLLQKLYADDFNEQFRDYMYANYPWRYASNFLNKSFAKTKALIIVSVIGILVFVLLFGYFQDKKFKYSFLTYFFPVLFISLNFSNLAYVYQYLTNVNIIVTWKAPLFVLVAGTVSAIIISLGLWLFDKLIVKESINFTLQLVIKVVLTFIAFNIPLVLLFLFGGNGNFQVLEFLESSSPIVFMGLALAIGRGLLFYINNVSDSLVKQKDVELSRLKEVNAQAEVKLLQSQINPHFLYNSLNSIASLAHKSADKTEKMALSLSDLFKYTINRKGKKNSTIGDEVEMVKNYLEVEQIRFDDRLNFTIEVDKTLENITIPMFLIQPLIENAVKHGISNLENNGQISLKINKDAIGFTIIVADNGPDFPDGLVSGHGLQTVFDLLRLTYKDNASISWENTPTKQIKITIEN